MNLKNRGKEIQLNVKLPEKSVEEISSRVTPDYTPPVGSGSKSEPPAGRYSDPENAAIWGLMN